jgi:hypothetical protein
MCSQKNHKEDYVNNLNCGHNVCGECLKGCAKCKNIVVSCPKCIVNYYFHKCKYCNIYLCNSCSRYCKNCEDDFCPYNKCINCNKISGNNCSNCINFKISGNKKEILSRYKCNKCKKKLENCEDCIKKYICGEKCYDEILLKLNINNDKNNDIYDNNISLEHKICQMFKCQDCRNNHNTINQSEVVNKRCNKILSKFTKKSDKKDDIEINSSLYSNKNSINYSDYRNINNLSLNKVIKDESFKKEDEKFNKINIENKNQIKQKVQKENNLNNSNNSNNPNVIKKTSKKVKVTCFSNCNIF